MFSLNTSDQWVANSPAIQGISLNPGVAIGRTAIYRPSFGMVYAEEISEAKEINRLEQGLKKLSQTLEEIIESSNHPQEVKDLVYIQLSLAKDKGWHEKIKLFIQKGNPVQTAVVCVLDEIHQAIGKKKFWKERFADFSTLSHRLINILNRNKALNNAPKLQPIVLVAEYLSPTEIIEYKNEQLVGLVLTESSPTAHAVILARSFNIPIIGGIKSVYQFFKPNQQVFIDGYYGKVYIEEEQVEEKTSKGSTSQSVALPKWDHELDLQKCITKDGKSISLNLNIGLPMDLKFLEKQNIDGIGLCRTEIPFMIQKKLPSVKMQSKIYKEILERANNKPVVFRTLDIGSDKILPYFQVQEEKNSNMGWRSIRISLDRPFLFKQQVKAMIHAASEKDLYIMVPFIATASEFKRAKEIIESEYSHALQEEKSRPNLLKIGMMVEIPSIIYQLSSFIHEVDFISIGTNDLFQFFFATDRMNPMLVNRYDRLSPAFLMLLKEISDVCKANATPFSVCGEMASFPLETMALMGIGFHNFSVSSIMVPYIKQMAQNLSYKDIQRFTQSLLEEGKDSLRQDFKNYASEKGIDIFF